MSKIEAGKFELSPVEFNFEKMINRVAQINQTKINDKKQKLLVHIDSAIPQTLYGDEQRLAQVITNLIGNAVKFTPEEGIISIITRYIGEEDDTRAIQISVTDTGIGISSEQQVRLFQSFQQADNNTANKFGGTGLGLAISKDIVEKMGGRIWIESELGKGAAFIFTVKLPAGARNAGKSNSENAAKITAADLYNDLHGRKLLIVEDIEINREILTAQLDGTGLTIDTAKNGKEAVDKVTTASAQYDFIFMDIQMPEMDGHIGKPVDLEDVLIKLQKYLL